VQEDRQQLDAGKLLRGGIQRRLRQRQSCCSLLIDVSTARRQLPEGEFGTLNIFGDRITWCGFNSFVDFCNRTVQRC